MLLWQQRAEQRVEAGWFRDGGTERAADGAWVAQQEVNLVEKEAFPHQCAVTTEGSVYTENTSSVAGLKSAPGDRERWTRDSHPTEEWAWGQKSKN